MLDDLKELISTFNIADLLDPETPEMFIANAVLVVGGVALIFFAARLFANR